MEIRGTGRPEGTMELTKTRRKEDNAKFAEVLQLRISQTDPASLAAGPESRAVVLDQNERVLGLIDEFAQALADPRRTLRDMESLVRTMEGEVRDLERAASVEGGPEQSLSELNSDVSLTAKVALFKFYRGDYA
jgi:hypothetical protein